MSNNKYLIFILTLSFQGESKRGTDRDYEEGTHVSKSKWFMVNGLTAKGRCHLVPTVGRERDQS